MSARPKSQIQLMGERGDGPTQRPGSVVPVQGTGSVGVGTRRERIGELVGQEPPRPSPRSNIGGAYYDHTQGVLEMIASGQLPEDVVKSLGLEGRFRAQKKRKSRRGPEWVVVMTYPFDPESERSKAKNRERVQIIYRLRSVGMIVSKVLSRDKDEVFVRIAAPSDRLEREAERVRLRMLTLPGAETETGAHMAEFSRNRKDIFLGSGDPECIFTSGERQRLILSIMEADKRDGGCEIDIKRLLTNKIFSQVFALHDDEAIADLKELWAMSFTAPQPLDDIRAYFGEKVALYFAWLGYYTMWLVGPACFGFVLFIIQLASQFDNLGVPVYSVFIALWATLFLEYWKRRNAELAFLWDVMDFEEEEKPRPDYFGYERLNPITKEGEIFYPPHKRYMKYMVSLPLILSLVTSVIFAALGILLFRAFLTKSSVLGSFTGGIVAGSLTAISIMVFNAIGAKVAIALTSWENHRTDTEYEDALIAKTFMFEFVNSYVSLFYIAFLKGHVTLFGVQDECKGESGCLQELMVQLGTVFLIQMFIGQTKEVLIPIIIRKVKEYLETRALLKIEGTTKSALKKLTKAEREAKMVPYEDVFEDYNEMIIQFGWVTLFAAAFPLASFAALVNNLVEIRSDAYKLCASHQRPWYTQAEDMGTWYYILEFMSITAVVTNMAILGYTSEQLDNFGAGREFSRLFVVTLAEHAILLLKIALKALVPDMPEWVANEVERIKYRKTKLVEEAEREAVENAEWEDSDAEYSDNYSGEEEEEEDLEKPEDKRKARPLRPEELTSREEIQRELEELENEEDEDM